MYSLSQSARSVRDTLRLIWSHPLTARNRSGAIARWLRWQVGSRLLPGRALVPFVDDTVLVVEPGMAGATGNVYVGLWEFADMAFVAHFLRTEDRFVDVGANVGTYTVLAAGVAGAHSVAVEPVPSTFGRLMTNVRVNGLDGAVRGENVGLASKPGKLAFTTHHDAMNHVRSNADGDAGDAIQVPVTTLDALLGESSATMIKVDVEGYETEVFAGGAATLSRPELQALIVELNGACARYGFDEDALRRDIEASGFRPFRYEPFARRLEPLTARTGDTGNTLYLRNPDAAQERVRAARTVRVLGLEL